MKKKSIQISAFQHAQITAAHLIKGGTDSEIIIIEDETMG